MHNAFITKYKKTNKISNSKFGNQWYLCSTKDFVVDKLEYQSSYIHYIVAYYVFKKQKMMLDKSFIGTVEDKRRTELR